MRRSWAALVACVVACSTGEAGAIVVRKNASEERAGQRLALIKVARSGSTLLWTHLTDTLREHFCTHNKSFQVELFNKLPFHKPYEEIRTAALGLLEDHLSCQNGDVCGFSLSLKKHSNWGYLQPGTQAFQDLVAALKAHSADVIILTRRNCFAQAVSFWVARKRGEALRSYNLDNVTCHGYDVYRCPDEIQTRVMNETFFCDEDKLERSVKSCESAHSAYQSFARAVGNATSGHVMSLDYEDLRSSTTWQALHKFIHVSAEAPKLRDSHDSASDYKRAMSNYESVMQLGRRLGYSSR